MADNNTLNLQFEGCLPKTKVVEKLWGKEIWAINTDNYCLKFMELKPNFYCSRHKHFKKIETFIVQKGEMVVTFHQYDGDAVTMFRMKPGDQLTLEAGMYHQFSNQTTEVCQFLEVSTHHDDDDVERLSGSGYVKSYTSQSR
jgi:uncharacterized cupin superfamily protein